MSKNGTNGVVAGSVWESRRKIDEFKGGIMVFKSEQISKESNDSPDEETIITNDKYISTSTCMNPTEQLIMDTRVNFKPKQTPPSFSGKRRTWKSDIIDANQIQVARQRSEGSKNVGEQCRELSVSADGTKKSPIQRSKARSAANKELSSSVESIDRTPFQRMKARSVSQKGLSESSNSIQKRDVQLRKIKSETSKLWNENGNEKSPGAKETKTEASKILDHSSSNDFDEKCQSLIVSGDGIKRTESDENFKDFGVCEEKLITSTSVNVGKGKSTTKSEMMIDNQEECLTDYDEEEDWDMVAEEDVDQEMKDQIGKKKHHQSNEKSVSASSVVMKKLPPVPGNVSVHSSPKKTKPSSPTKEFEKVSRSHSTLDSFVDLVMWRDVSKSAFIFGVGTFVIISSSYTQDLNISAISILSYIGLVYLAAIFLFRSFIYKGVRDVYSTSQGHIIGEEEAVWLIKLIIPYVNEFLLKIRALFSGDPATTMRMAVLLFVLARCGSSITIWKMAKLGFLGVFIVPKVCSSYSSQTTAYGKFWIRRFQDAWETCSQKKAVAFGVFALVWNLSSIVARIWAVFMLFVAFKYYQQSLMGEEYRGVETTSTNQENSRQGQLQRHRKERKSMIIVTSKQMKPF